RTGDRLLVTAQVRGTIRITADERIAQDLSTSPTYRQAIELRAAGTDTTEPTTAPTTSPTTKPIKVAPILYKGSFEAASTREGKLAVVFTNGVELSRRQT